MHLHYFAVVNETFAFCNQNYADYDEDDDDGVCNDVDGNGDDDDEDLFCTDRCQTRFAQWEKERVWISVFLIQRICDGWFSGWRIECM